MVHRDKIMKIASLPKYLWTRLYFLKTGRVRRHVNQLTHGADMTPTPMAVEDIHKPSNHQDGRTAIWTENVWVYLVSSLAKNKTWQSRFGERMSSLILACRPEAAIVWTYARRELAQSCEELTEQDERGREQCPGDLSQSCLPWPHSWDSECTSKIKH